MTNEEKVFYNMLKNGATPEEITKAITAAQKTLDQEKAEAKKKEAAEKARKEQIENAREELAYAVMEYLPLVYPEAFKDITENDEKWEKEYESVKNIFKSLEKGAENKSKRKTIFDDFDFSLFF